eukprot:1410482-Pyramimonas_sp.AAC.1
MRGGEPLEDKMSAIFSEPRPIAQSRHYGLCHLKGKRRGARLRERKRRRAQLQLQHQCHRGKFEIQRCLDEAVP